MQKTEIRTLPQLNCCDELCKLHCTVSVVARFLGTMADRGVTSCCDAGTLFCPQQNRALVCHVSLQIQALSQISPWNLLKLEWLPLTSITRYTLWDKKKRSSDIREQLSIFNINDRLTQYKINWREHIQRMDDNRLPKKF